MTNRLTRASSSSDEENTIEDNRSYSREVELLLNSLEKNVFSGLRKHIDSDSFSDCESNKKILVYKNYSNDIHSLMKQCRSKLRVLSFKKNDS